MKFDPLDAFDALFVRLTEKPALVSRRYSDWETAPISAGGPIKPQQWMLRELDAVFRDLSYSPSFQVMLSQAPQIADLNVFTSPFRKGETASGYYNHAGQRVAIRVNPHWGDGWAALAQPPRQWILPIVAHEMRHGFQHIAGHADLVRMAMTPYFMRGFLIEADANAFAVTVAWELKQAGRGGGYWRDFKRSHPDIARAFVAEIKNDPQSLYDGRAQHAAALAWFADEYLPATYGKKYLSEIKEWLAQPVEKEVAAAVARAVAKQARADYESSLRQEWARSQYRKALPPPSPEKNAADNAADEVLNRNEEKGAQRGASEEPVVEERTNHIHADPANADQMGVDQIGAAQAGADQAAAEQSDEQPAPQDDQAPQSDHEPEADPDAARNAAGLMGYFDAAGVVRARPAYLNTATMPQAHEYYMRRLTPAFRREMDDVARRMDQRNQDVDDAVKRAMRERGRRGPQAP